MIVVDSSVWIANLRGQDTDAVRKLHAIDLALEQVAIGDLILMEVLMGCRDEAIAARVLADLLKFELVTLGMPEVAVDAAWHYRVLRQRGFTIRAGIDMLIGAYCLHGGHRLLHAGRDFDVMAQHLGLAVL